MIIPVVPVVLAISDNQNRGTVYYIPGVEVPTPDEVFAGDAMLETLTPSDLNSEGLVKSSEGLEYEGLEYRIIHILDGLKTQLRNELEKIAAPAKTSRKLQQQEMSDVDLQPL